MNTWLLRSCQDLFPQTSGYRLRPGTRLYSTYYGVWSNLVPPHHVSRYIIYHLCQRAGCGGKSFQLVEQTSSSGRSPPTMIRGAIPRPQIGGCFTPDSGTSAPGRHEEATTNSRTGVVNKHSFNSSGIAQTQLKNHRPTSWSENYDRGVQIKGRRQSTWVERGLPVPDQSLTR